MKSHRMAKQIIQILEDRGFYAECPCCEKPVPLKDCGLFYLDDFTPEAKEAFDAVRSELRERARGIHKRREDISKSSEVGAKAVNIGYILERLAPSMPAFQFDRNDCRSIFDPIDYLVFEGLSSGNRVSRMFFVEIKTGGASLERKQKEIRSLVESKKVSLEVYSSEKVDEE